MTTTLDTLTVTSSFSGAMMASMYSFLTPSSTSIPKHVHVPVEVGISTIKIYFNHVAFTSIVAPSICKRFLMTGVQRFKLLQGQLLVYFDDYSVKDENNILSFMTRFPL